MKEIEGGQTYSVTCTLAFNGSLDTIHISSLELRVVHMGSFCNSGMVFRLGLGLGRRDRRGLSLVIFVLFASDGSLPFTLTRTLCTSWRRTAGAFLNAERRYRRVLACDGDGTHRTRRKAKDTYR